MAQVILVDDLNLYKLTHRVERFKKECAMDAPTIIKSLELELIKQACDELKEALEF